MNSQRKRESSATFIKVLLVNWEDVIDGKTSSGKILLITMIHFCVLSTRPCPEVEDIVLKFALIICKGSLVCNKESTLWKLY